MGIVRRFWHRDCVAGVSERSFSESYAKWCTHEGYQYSAACAARIYQAAKQAVAVFPKNDSVKALIVQAVDTLNAVYASLQVMREEMQRLAEQLPEYEIVMGMYGVGAVTGPQLIAEIGDVRRFTNKAALVAFAGVDAPPYQSGTFDSKSRHISKRGSPHLRRIAFMVCSAILQKRAIPTTKFMHSWTKSERKESISMSIWLRELQNFCGFTTPV